MVSVYPVVKCVFSSHCTSFFITWWGLLHPWLKCRKPHFHCCFGKHIQPLRALLSIKWGWCWSPVFRICLGICWQLGIFTVTAISGQCSFSSRTCFVSHVRTWLDQSPAKGIGLITSIPLLIKTSGLGEQEYLSHLDIWAWWTGLSSLSSSWKSQHKEIIISMHNCMVFKIFI